MRPDIALTVAVQAVLWWRQGQLIPERIWALTGPYAPLLQELQTCQRIFESLPVNDRALRCGDLWLAIRAWPQFDRLADAVEAFERRIADACSA